MKFKRTRWGPNNKRPRGRPRKVIDFKMLDRLCEIQCTIDEICSVLDVTDATLNARCQERFGCDFSVYYEQRRSHGKVSLRRMQYIKAMSGNTTLLMWLGKQWLGQAEKTQLSGDKEKPLSVMVVYEDGHPYSGTHDVESSSNGVSNGTVPSPTQ